MMIRPLERDDLIAVKAFTDRAIGSNYYSILELNSIFDKSIHDGKTASLVLVDAQNAIFGIRLTYPPGQWSSGKGKGLRPESWKVPMENVAYFQSLFIDPEFTSQGWGRKMSQISISILKAMKAKAVVTHSWRESPQDSSGKYLRNLGFQIVESHPLYWFEVDYVCTRCGKPCVCTADEMILYI